MGRKSLNLLFKSVKNYTNEPGVKRFCAKCFAYSYHQIPTNTNHRWSEPSVHTTVSLNSVLSTLLWR